jgi:hypothetical protein
MIFSKDKNQLVRMTKVVVNTQQSVAAGGHLTGLKINIQPVHTTRFIVGYNPAVL